MHVGSGQGTSRIEVPVDLRYQASTPVKPGTWLVLVELRYQASVPVKGGSKLVYWWNWGIGLCTSRMRLVLDCTSRMRYQAGVPVEGRTRLVYWWN